MKSNIKFERAGDYELMLYTDTNEAILLDEDILFSIWDMIESQKIYDELKTYFKKESNQNFNILDNLPAITEFYRMEKDEMNNQLAPTIIRLAIADYDYSKEDDEDSDYEEEL